MAIEKIFMDDVPASERDGYSLALANALEQLSCMEAQKKSEAKESGLKISEAKISLDALGEIVRTGKVKVTTMCKWVGNGKNKKLIREDTGEVVETSQITNEDRQKEFGDDGECL